MGEATVLVEQRGHVAIVTLNRPERANTIDDVLQQDLREAMVRLANDRSTRAIVVTGAGRHFCGGADLRATRNGPAFVPGYSIDFDWVPQPVIAAINGAAMGGGCEIALACDVRIIATTASIGLPEIRFGELPAGGGTARLPRVVGLSNAKRLIMTGEAVDAGQALAMGLVDEVAEPEDLLTAALRLAETLAARAPYAVRAAKFLLNRALDTELAPAMALELRVVATMATADERAEARAEAAAGTETYAKIFSAPDSA